MVRPQEHNLLELLAHVVGEHVDSQHGWVSKTRATVAHHLQNQKNYFQNVLRITQLVRVNIQTPFGALGLQAMD